MRFFRWEAELKSDRLTILYEDNHLLVLNKPVLTATMGLPAGEVSLHSAAKEYLAEKYQKPGNVYLGVVSRLDLVVSGAVVFARTSKAAERLNEQFRTHTVEKIYHAVVEGNPPPSGTLRDWIAEDGHGRKSFITKIGANADDSKVGRFRRENVTNGPPKEGILHFKRLARIGRYALLEVKLETGRKHQIRLQLSHAGYPILGDRKYGSDVVLARGIALHARRLAFDHPTTRERLDFVAEYPDFWQEWVK